MINSIPDFEKVISDEVLFNQVVYTSLPEAVKILKDRQKDKKLIKKIEDILEYDIPEPLKKIDLYGINAKQLATPNIDTKWFIRLVKEFGLKPYFSEYYSDKFTSNNVFKHSLGVIHIKDGIYKDGESKLENITIVDFNKYNGKPIKDVRTLWSESLIDFHHDLFKVSGIKKEDLIFHDDSSWLKRNGGSAEKYYEKDMLLYVSHGILFENFLLTGEDRLFAKKILLPAFKKALEITGHRPLIVPIPPMDIQEDSTWYSYDNKIKKYINRKFDLNI